MLVGSTAAELVEAGCAGHGTPRREQDAQVSLPLKSEVDIENRRYVVATMPRISEIGDLLVRHQSVCLIVGTMYGKPLKFVALFHVQNKF